MHRCHTWYSSIYHFLMVCEYSHTALPSLGYVCVCVCVWRQRPLLRIREDSICLPPFKDWKIHARQHRRRHTCTHVHSHTHKYSQLVERCCHCISKNIRNLHWTIVNLIVGYQRAGGCLQTNIDICLKTNQVIRRISFWCYLRNLYARQLLNSFCSAARWPSKPQQWLGCICFSAYELWTQLALLFMNYYWSACLHRIVAGTNAFTL